MVNNTISEEMVCENNNTEANEQVVIQTVEVERKLTTGEKIAGVGLLAGAAYAAVDLGIKGFKLLKNKFGKSKEPEPEVKEPEVKEVKKTKKSEQATEAAK